MGRLHLKVFLFMVLQGIALLFISLIEPQHRPAPRIPLDYQVKLNATILNRSLPRDSKDDAKTEAIKPLCTEKLFKEYFKKKHTLPTNAHLVVSKVLKQAYMLLDMCAFNFRNTTVAGCLEKKGVRKLTVLGDMHARQYAMAIMRIFANSSFECDMIRKEKIVYSDGHNKSTVPDKEYYSHRSYGQWSTAELGLRNNKQWRSSMHTCFALTKDSSIHSLNIEYLNMMNLTSKLLTLRGWTEGTSADTYEEFLFKIYLRDNFPDVLVIVLPEDHRRQVLPEQKAAIKAFVEIVKQYVPASTRVVWVPATAEVERKKQKKKKPISEATFRRNMFLYRTIESDVLLSNASHSTFINLYNASMPWTGSGQNGLLPQKWYEAVMTSLLAIPCNA
ncbi:hypothetical protein CAPTEDRAFT_223185 [Capitella teleta]|uniref:Uncharacterized protein n=1 Tax=Capitella teleta TaxID=283909 RepID=R7T8Y7_CAPTE|nr:hypothetical protein CAPTEDRAFT_223185 [Capitella teleta]|eukprot:ELT87459.1 hypothetical protein CAPTEDRAFT_223185 [Capitella teleta]